MNLKLLDLYRNCVTTFHLSQEHFAQTNAPIRLAEQEYMTADKTTIT